MVLPATRVAFDQLAGRTNLEVENLSLWTGTPSVRIGFGTGFEETRTVTDITLRNGLSTTVNAPTVIGDTIITVPGGGSAGFPQGDGVNPDGYRIIIDEGGANEEIIVVRQNDVPGNRFITLTATTKNHAGAETIKLLNDVLTTDKLTKNHKASTVTPTTQGELVEPYTTKLSLAAAASFPTSGYAIINFGNSRVSTRSKITNIAGVTITLASTANFPTANFPYQVIVGDGVKNQEFASVIANNTGLNQLTLAAGLALAHSNGEYISFTAGTPEVLEYTSKSGNDLLFPAIVLESYHTIGESVRHSSAESEPVEDGYSFPFRMPPDPGNVIKVLIDLARAAGVQVVIVNER